MKHFLALTKLIKIKKNSEKIIYNFHFIGVYDGKKIQKIQVEKSDKNLTNLSVREDYLLYLKFLCVENEVLSAEIIKSKKVSEIFR